MNRILIIRLSALGDVAMTLPVIYSLAESYPDTQFTLLTQKVAGKLLIHRPVNLSVMAADVKGTHKGLIGLYRLYRQLKPLQFSAVADLHGVLRSKALSFFFKCDGIRTATINKGRAEKKKLTARKKKNRIQLKSSFERYKDVFKQLGLVPNDTFRSVYKNEKGSTVDFATITPPKANDEKWVGIAPFAKHTGKIYPIDKMEKVVASLIDIPGVKLFLFGGGNSEKAIFERWAQKCPHIVTVSDSHGFAKELALISHLEVMISMDSANMHLASLVGTPVISIWGATHYFAGFLGWKQQAENIIASNMPCRPCSVFGNKPCFRGDYACMKQITPQQITDKVLGLIRSK